MKRPLAALLGILLVLSICVGCGPKGDISSGVAEQDFPVTVNEVTIQDEPKGVVVLSLWRSATRCNSVARALPAPRRTCRCCRI